MKMSEIHGQRNFKASRLALPLAALLWLPGAATCAQAGIASAAPAGKPSTTAQSAAQWAMIAQYNAMLDMQKHLQVVVNNYDAQLDKLTAAMNQATGTQKIDDIATLVTKLVAQREQMHERMLAMQSEMLLRMAGEFAPAAQSSATRPMMNGAGSAKAENKQHQL